jgi:MFS family permease
VAAVSLSLVSIQLAHSSYPAVLPLIREEWAISNTAAGLIQASFYAGYLLAVVSLLPLTDRGVDTRYVWFASILVAALSHASFPLLAQNVASAALLRAAAGFGTLGVYMPGVRLISERFSGGRRGGLGGIYLSAFGLSNALSFALTGGLVPLLGWRDAYLVAGSIGFVGLLPGLYVLRSSGVRASAEGKLPPVSAWATITHRPLLLVVLAYAVHNWELLGMKAWIASFLALALVSRGAGLALATAQAGLLTAALGILGALSMAGTGRISDRYGRTATSSVIMLAGAACSFAIGWLLHGPLWLLITVALIYGIAAVAESPILTTAVTELAPPGRLGAAQASQSFLGNIPSILAPLAFGAILDGVAGTGGWVLAFSSMGLGGVAGVALMLALRRREESLILAGGRR